MTNKSFQHSIYIDIIKQTDPVWDALIEEVNCLPVDIYMLIFDCLINDPVLRNNEYFNKQAIQYN